VPQTLSDIRAALDAANTRPRHRFGQNFMVEPDLVRRIADAGEVGPEDQVIEVGPGTGTLTQELLDRGANVLAVEIDRDLAAALSARSLANLTVLEADALAGKHALHPTVEAAAAGGAKLVANLPYNIASPLVVELLIAGSPLLAFTVQKEVADRLAATVGKAYGPLSVIVQSLATVEIVRTIPPTAFWPRPKIDSALVRLRRRPDPPADPRSLSAFVTAGFGQRRKAVRNPLARLMGARTPDLLASVGLTGAERAETISPTIWQELHDAAGE
jgi:16S rRNA (adenine1518-N6/adenine1519-N6)-dimethyltransferase